MIRVSQAFDVSAHGNQPFHDTPYPRAMAVAARTMSTTSMACTTLIRAKRLAAPVSGAPPRATAARHRISASIGPSSRTRIAASRPIFAPEDVVVEIIEAALFEPSERPDQARADPQEGGNAPPGIGVEDAPQSGDVERRLQRAGASPDGAKSYTEREQMECGQQPSDRHVVSQARSHTQGTPSSWPSSIRYSSSNFRACPTQLAPISPRLRPSGTRSAGSAR